MYASKLAVSVKSDGHFLREQGDVVHLPFGSEYSVAIKHTGAYSSQGRASVKLIIDGVSVTGDASLVIDPGEVIEIERFVKNGNFSKGNRFKFIERTGAVEAHRGIGPSDSLIRVEFQFEQIANPIMSRRIDLTKLYQPMYDPYYPQFGQLYATSCVKSNHALTQNAAVHGITVPGSVSTQQFHTVDEFQLEPWIHIIQLRLVGAVKQQYVSKTVSTRQRLTCVTCGHSSKSNAKFCSQCGTSLNII